MLSKELTEPFSRILQTSSTKTRQVYGMELGLVPERSNVAA